MKKTQNILRPIISSGITIGIAAYIFIICLQGLNRPYIEDGWQVTQGTVLSQDLTLPGKANVQRKNEGVEQLINYEYNVSNRIFQSNSVSRQTLVAKDYFIEGKIINVFYNPNNPDESVLVRTKTQKEYLYAMMIFCLALSGFTLFKFIKVVKNK